MEIFPYRDRLILNIDRANSGRGKPLELMDLPCATQCNTYINQFLILMAITNDSAP